MVYLYPSNFINLLQFLHFNRIMKKASNYAFIQKPKQCSQPVPKNMGGINLFPPVEADLNVVQLSFDQMKEAQKNLAGGDPYSCKKCGAILNKFSVVKNQADFKDEKVQLKPNESLWNCEFCHYPNTLLIQKEEIPVKDDVVYMLESALEMEETQNDETIVFCIDVSGSMNSTSEIAGKVDLKFGLSQEEIDMLKTFMEPGDEAQFNFLPGAHNKNKTFISRKQCVLSAIESQILQIQKKDPHKRVGFVLFSDEVTVIGDGKAENVHIVGDKLNNVPHILAALGEFKLTTPLAQNYDLLLNKLSKTEAKGQTALGPALVSAIEVASRGGKGSVVVLCTDGMANVGVGALEVVDESKYQFYDEVAIQAKEKHVAVNIVTIKGESSKLEVLSKVAEATNGNVKVVNPQKLSDDFANILKDEVVGLNVEVKIMLHKALIFRNEDAGLLKDNKTILAKQFANATAKTKISFEYEVRQSEDLKFLEIDIEALKKVPFQSQIIYTSSKGGKFLRVISSESQTTTEKKEMEKEANISVVHQRIASQTAAMYSKGAVAESEGYNNAWSNYMNDNFLQAPEHQGKQERFNSRNMRMKDAISNKVKKMERRQMNVVEEEQEMVGEEEEKPEKAGFLASLFGSKKKGEKETKSKKVASKQMKKEKEDSHDSDEDEMEIKNYMMSKNDCFM